jgi:CRP/FNR family transcriptional regulator, cyclic AMP receptor protein
MSKITIEKFCQRFPQFAAALNDAEIETLLDALRVQTYEASEALIEQGTMMDSLFLVWDGELDVLMNTPEGEKKIAEITRGSLLGEISLLNPGPATATIRSEQGCMTLHLDHQNWQELWQANPHIAGVLMSEILKLVSRRIRSADATLHRLLAEQQAHSLDDLRNVRAGLFKETV